MTHRFIAPLVDDASRPFRASGRFAYHYARGKLSADTLFHALLSQDILPPQGHYLDLGCGQGSFFAWLLAARARHQSGDWPAAWPAAPQPLSLRGIELMPRDVDRAARAFAASQPLVRIEQGDMTTADFGRADVVTIFDALHYFDHARQVDVLKRIHAALPPGGLFLTRIGDAAAGLPYHLCNGVDHVVTFLRGHRLPRLYCRPLADWSALLAEVGFSTRSLPMSGRKPFANTLLICHRTA